MQSGHAELVFVSSRQSAQACIVPVRLSEYFARLYTAVHQAFVVRKLRPDPVSVVNQFIEAGGKRCSKAAGGMNRPCRSRRQTTLGWLCSRISGGRLYALTGRQVRCLISLSAIPSSATPKHPALTAARYEHRLAGAWP